MSFLSNEEYVSEMTCGSDFAYVLTDRLSLSVTEYKVLQNQKDGCFIRCVQTKYNGRTQLYYLTGDYKSLESIVSKIDAEKFMTIASNLISNIIELKNNGFLSCHNVQISINKIFVDVGTLRTYLIYVPTDRRIYDDVAEFENELRANLIRLIAGVATLSAPAANALMEYLSDSTLFLEDVYIWLCNRTGENLSETESRLSFNRSLVDGMGTPAGMQMSLLSINMPLPEEIKITKNIFVLGKSKNNVDATISFNPMISRIHCKVERQNGSYYLFDLGSSNGTYVNGKRLMPNTGEQLVNGDIIRLANTEFRAIIK